MVCVRPLAEDERQQLKRLARREVGRVSERIRRILLSSRGYRVQQIAEIFECDEATVRRWIARVEAAGVEGLRDRPRAGRPRKADAAARERIRQQVETPPATAGYVFGFWTVVPVASHLAERFGLRLSQPPLRRVLRALEFRWRRPRHALPQDPAAATKRWQGCERVLAAPAEAVLLCLDEWDLHLVPVLRAMWMRKGQQQRVPTPGTNRQHAIFGALEWTTGRWIYGVFPRKRAVEFLAFLEQLRLAYPGRPLLLVLDNASIHTAKVVGEWLAQQPQVELLFLPTYSGHEQNPGRERLVASEGARGRQPAARLDRVAGRGGARVLRLLHAPGSPAADCLTNLERTFGRLLSAAPSRTGPTAPGRPRQQAGLVTAVPPGNFRGRCRLYGRARACGGHELSCCHTWRARLVVRARGLS